MTNWYVDVGIGAHHTSPMKQIPTTPAFPILFPKKKISLSNQINQISPLGETISPMTCVTLAERIKKTFLSGWDDFCPWTTVILLLDYSVQKNIFEQQTKIVFLALHISVALWPLLNTHTYDMCDTRGAYQEKFFIIHPDVWYGYPRPPSHGATPQDYQGCREVW